MINSFSRLKASEGTSVDRRLVTAPCVHPLMEPFADHTDWLWCFHFVSHWPKLIILYSILASFSVSFATNNASKFSVYLNVSWEKNFPIVLLKEKKGYVLFEVESYSKVLRQQKTCFFSVWLLKFIYLEATLWLFYREIEEDRERELFILELSTKEKTWKYLTSYKSIHHAEIYILELKLHSTPFLNDLSSLCVVQLFFVK